MSQGTITVPKPQMIELTTDMDGFSVTMKALKAMGLNMKGISIGAARIIYNSGVAFAKTENLSEKELNLWRNRCICPVKGK